MIAVTVDTVVFVPRPAGVSVLLVERRFPPYQGAWALPGGFVEEGEDLPEAAARELAEETGITGLDLRQLGAYGTPGRDPRGHTVSIVYWAIADPSIAPEAGDDAAKASLVPVDEALADPGRMAFDHHRILSDAYAAWTQNRNEASAR
ncbi:MAG: NUDIX hydrolase [Actinomycetes bacterium]|nr:MAG: NUDIX hydrolase [Actinomycetota bacterium]